MSIYAKPGTKVRFLGVNGYVYELAEAKQLLSTDATYVVGKVEVDRFRSEVMLEEFPGRRFNTAMFAEVREPAPKPSALEEVARLPNGSTLYREPNEVGGHRYWSDEIGGGVCVWDTCLVDRATLLAALLEEERRVREAIR
jgi:hypothetical protein